MSIASTDTYGRRALEAVEQISAAGEDAGLLSAVINKEMAAFGFDYVTSWTLPIVGEQIECMDINTRPEAYTDHYQKDRVLNRDPVVRTLRRTLNTTSWSDVKAEGLTRSERSVIDEAIEFGADDGLTIPVLARAGCVGVFSPCGHRPDVSPRARAAVELIGLYAYQSLQRARTKAARSRRVYTPLSPREREVLRWVAIGKTNGEIGDILGIQVDTVKTILSRAQEKLDAGRRTYAVVQAIKLGELDLNF